MLNQDYSKRIAIETSQQPWEESYAGGIARKKLERQQEESGKATSIVRYEKGSSFPTHVHSGGEEIYVLEGVFSDETGDYSAGNYIRNPIGTSHAPHSEQGCILFVKLCYFDPQDTKQFVVDTTKQQWLPGLVAGLQVMPLHVIGTEHTALVKWSANTQFNPHQHWGGEEILVLQGEFFDEHGSYPEQTWIRSPHMSKHTPFVKEKETIILVKTGHLQHVAGT